MNVRDRQQMINLLTGVQSSKKSYYNELRKTVIALKKKNMQLEIINDVTKSFNIDMSIDEMLQNVFDKLQTILPIERISLSMCENEKLVLTNVYPPHSLYFPIGFDFSKKRSLYWKVVESLEKIFYQVNFGKERSYIEDKVYESLGIRSVLLVPLIRKGKVIGVLSIGSKQIMEYDEDDLAFFQQFCDQLAVCIENARLYNEVLTSKKEWEETFRAVSEMIFVVDLKGNILKYNDAAKEFFQLHQREKQDFHQLLSMDIHHSPVLQIVQTKKPVYQEIHFQKRVCELRGYPVLNENEHIYAIIIYINDITEKRRIEAQLVQSGKLAAIGEMAAGIAHELNNPLTAILGNAQLLLRTAAKDDRSYKLLYDIYSCGRRCKTIIQNLLTFSRQDEYMFEDCSVNEAVEQVLGLIGDQIRKQNIIIRKKLDNSLELVEGNIQQIGQIVLNLLINAKDALEEVDVPEKVISIETKSVAEEEKKWVLLTIQDNGKGIEEQYLQEIFNPFFTTKRPGKGTGLGLSVSLGIAQAHGGTIEVASKPGKGSTFMLKLPAKQ
ncbi:GAF domain-containing sensor histidine kinase [Parageobacillus thermoglucosidasius]|uniref:histidine kinase n=2 Tax=Anoxybacillaceae TaxID=3120669 RepID=A0AAN1D5W0_PARTM|nr:ATP-binding protein [Parageobacillus thermoglucosidasius]ALF09198.1 histidine kinase [Parageobacillus thermoglucosidasius]ANZ29281.1 histidine kinase [Parageobacillus thermoglucosidasius]APM80019.1 histidine kinase [Parageobacillus thermoglucosidasius]KJX69970.1 histidine kinase [Parageobacillus thermoglucosidasius]MBY6266732.1 histidine kinase [Parageobacillus thermoglucosidasius]